MDRATWGTTERKWLALCHTRGRGRAWLDSAAASLPSAHLSHATLLKVLDSGPVRPQGQAAASCSRIRRVYTGLLSYHCQLPGLGRQKGKETMSLYPVTSGTGAGRICFLFGVSDTLWRGWLILGLSMLGTQGRSTQNENRNQVLASIFMISRANGM